MANITPQTSATGGPGFTPNPSGATTGGAPSNAYYRETLAKWMASMWAHGGDSRQKVLDMMSPVWYSAKYGEPEPTDEGGYWSPRTLMSFSRFASEYTGGSPALDQIFPYVPPGPNDFIETPEQTANRIAQSAFEKQIQADIDKTAMEIAATAAEGNANRAVDIEEIKANLKASAMSAFNQAFSNEVQKFNVESGMWNNQQNIQSSNLQQAGNLASAFQQILDQRTGKAIESQLNPGDWLAREAQVRAMTAPQGTETPAYSDFPELKIIIDMLKNTAGGGAKPVGPDANTFQLPDLLKSLIEYTPTAPPPTTGVVATPAPPQVATPPPAQTPAASPIPTYPGPGAGGAPTADNFSGVRNEDVAELLSGQGKLITTGTLGPSYGRDYTNFKVFNPSKNNYQYQPDDEIAAGTPVWLQKFAYGVRKSRNPQFVSGDPQADGKPNPEVVTIHNPGKKTRVSVTPVKNAKQMQGKRKFALGADAFDPNNLKIKSYPDEAYQNYSSLDYLKGGSKNQYNKLNTGMFQGYGGAMLPESGAINYGNYLNVAKDPVSLAMLASHYKTGSRDLFAEVARAKARAPFGQAVQTSLIRS